MKASEGDRGGMTGMGSPLGVGDRDMGCHPHPSLPQCLLYLPSLPWLYTWYLSLDSHSLGRPCDCDLVALHIRNATNKASIYTKTWSVAHVNMMLWYWFGVFYVWWVEWKLQHPRGCLGEKVGKNCSVMKGQWWKMAEKLNMAPEIINVILEKSDRIYTQHWN